MQPIYDIKNLHYQYKFEPVLNIKQLKVMPSSIVGLVGANGSGKSTLLKLMAFIHKANEGQIFFNGIVTNNLSKADRLKVTLLTQKAYLMKRTIYQNIIYGLKIRKVKKQFYNSKVKFALDLVGLDFDTFATRKWNALSGGEVQRVALAARLILRPQVLLMDEPTTNMDNSSSKLIKYASMMARKQWGTTLIIASHDVKWLNAICDKIIFMLKGKIASISICDKTNDPLIKISKKLIKKYSRVNKNKLLSHPSCNNSFAFVNSKDMKIYNQKINYNDKKHLLEGTITQLRLDNKKNDSILLHIKINDMVIIKSITKKNFYKMAFKLGESVKIEYNPNKNNDFNI